ncbi:FxSxx-COOH system tetratricopeptide repeat protein [Dactylosporangium sp. NPDC049525]|uniref:FxSxx-COOH system tetratricopeptide repeat protein n=1 Tax=Dactylosporangium sp. NPDC049525 TaxID=3154730 RepID=UPI003441D7FF
MSDTATAEEPLAALVDVLLQVNALSDANVRDILVEETAAVLRRKFTSRRTPDARDDLLSLIHSLDLLSGGVVTFTRVVAGHHPLPPALRAAKLAGDIRGDLLLSGPDRQDLCRILGVAGTSPVFGALGELSAVPELQDFRIWQDWPAVVMVMERQPVPGGGVPPLLAFVTRLARLLDSNTGSALRRWAANVAGGLGVTEVEHDALRLGDRDDESSGPRRRPGGARPIRGSLPLQNQNFTGRAALLERLARTLASGSKAAVLPHAVHGMGGVGKTQLVLEYVYRHLEDYDLVWWVPADAASGVLASLEQLAGPLGIRPGDNAQQTARLVLDALAAGALKWLLVYDNANDLDSIDEYVPSTGGDVVVTTRNREWAAVGLSIEVDVFERHESIDLLRQRTANSISTVDADRLAERLGDLPLALEQAAAWHLLTKMPVSQYIDLLEQHQKELLSEGKPAGYPASVVAFVTLAIEKLRSDAPATAQLLELFAFLGGEPVPVSLLRYGRDADVVQPLRALLGDPIKINLAVRDLNQYGLVKVDNAQRLQVHRLVQGVLRDALDDQRADEILRSAQNLLAQANPGDPDEKDGRADLDRQREIGPHLESADMIRAVRIEARSAVVDHVRYLYNMGDYENSRRIAEDAVRQWETSDEHPKLGYNGELTLQARAHTANAMRALGQSDPADELTNDTYDRMKQYLGENAKSTIVLGNQMGQALRIRGAYAASLAFAVESLDRHQAALDRGEFLRAEPYVLRAQSNLAVAYRMVGDFAEAANLDQATVNYWERSEQLATSFGALEAYMNIARDYYGLGAYKAGLAVLDGWRGSLLDQRSTGHRLVLGSGRTYGIMLRKDGQLRQAAGVLSENLEQTLQRFGANHEYTVAVLCSYGNALRQLGDTDGALEHITEAVRRYKEYFGDDHPLTLVALVNEAVARRAAGDYATAMTLDALAYERLTDVLGGEHPYTLCAGTSLATDHSVREEHEEARALSAEMLQRSRSVSGGPHEVRNNAEHPYLLARAINLAHDLRATGATDEAQTLLLDSLAGLRRALGDSHPEVMTAERGDRLEGDIEAPPT